MTAYHNPSSIGTKIKSLIIGQGHRDSTKACIARKGRKDADPGGGTSEVWRVSSCAEGARGLHVGACLLSRGGMISDEVSCWIGINLRRCCEAGPAELAGLFSADLAAARWVRSKLK